MVEVTLSLSILLIIFTMTIPAYRAFMVRNDLDTATMSLVENLRRAQILSQVTDGDSSWGIHVATGSILLYKGVNYVSRDQAYDEDTSVSASIVFSGLNDVLFSKQTGMPQSTGTTTLTSTTNEVRNVTINQKGMVDY
jgi:type II secretory pathway pseudopilin PulG